MLRAMLVTKQDHLLSRDHRTSGNWSSRTLGAKREGVARETEQLELKLEEPETSRGQISRPRVTPPSLARPSNGSPQSALSKVRSVASLRTNVASFVSRARDP
jgi:hypothetical protein